MFQLRKIDNSGSIIEPPLVSNSMNKWFQNEDENIHGCDGFGFTCIHSNLQDSKSTTSNRYNEFVSVCSDGDPRCFRMKVKQLEITYH